jgi:hypothetical protein
MLSFGVTLMTLKDGFAVPTGKEPSQRQIAPVVTTDLTIHHHTDKRDGGSGRP